MFYRGRVKRPRSLRTGERRDSPFIRSTTSTPIACGTQKRSCEMYIAPRESKTVGFGGVLFLFSFAIERQLTPQIFDLAGGSYAELKRPSETKRKE